MWAKTTEGSAPLADPWMQPEVQWRSEEDWSTFVVIVPALSKECATFSWAQIVAKGTAAAWKYQKKKKKNKLYIYVITIHGAADKALLCDSVSHDSLSN